MITIALTIVGIGLLWAGITTMLDRARSKTLSFPEEEEIPELEEFGPYRELAEIGGPSSTTWASKLAHEATQVRERLYQETLQKARSKVKEAIMDAVDDGGFNVVVSLYSRSYDSKGKPKSPAWRRNSAAANTLAKELRIDGFSVEVVAISKGYVNGVADDFVEMHIGWSEEK